VPLDLLSCRGRRAAGVTGSERKIVGSRALTSPCVRHAQHRSYRFGQNFHGEWLGQESHTLPQRCGILNQTVVVSRHVQDTHIESATRFLHEFAAVKLQYPALDKFEVRSIMHFAIHAVNI